ncbi:zinc finger protein 809-like [Adelges cooleyi]|uniref:zinc finger protein 809-like n=1 Tax=Adelges cooleyi TaxID=133065 RepID=UPI0021803D27|nr:zinc finger protein 809-like [Adelges cooleyi]
MAEDEKFSCSTVETVTGNPIYSVTVIKREPDETENDNYSKSEVEYEENQDLAFIMDYDVDVFASGNINCPAVVKTEAEEVNKDYYFKYDIEIEENEGSHVNSIYTSDTISKVRYDRSCTEEEPFISTQEELIMYKEKLTQPTLCLSTFTQSKKHEQPFQCLVCLKEFSTSSVLTKHKRTHSGRNLSNASYA